MTDDEILTVVQAHKDGKQIQFEWEGEWTDTDGPSWDFASMEYRVKPEPHYVPYDSVSEVERNKWVKRKGTSELLRPIVMLDPKRNKVIPFVGEYYSWRTLKEMFNKWEYEDGTPFGKIAKERSKKHEIQAL